MIKLIFLAQCRYCVEDSNIQKASIDIDPIEQRLVVIRSKSNHHQFPSVVESSLLEKPCTTHFNYILCL